MVSCKFFFRNNTQWLFPGQLQYAGDDLKKSKGIPLDARPPEEGDPLNAPKELLVPLDELSEAYWSSSVAGRNMKAELSEPFKRLAEKGG